MVAWHSRSTPFTCRKTWSVTSRMPCSQCSQPRMARMVPALSLLLLQLLLLLIPAGCPRQAPTGGMCGPESTLRRWYDYKGALPWPPQVPAPCPGSCLAPFRSAAALRKSDLADLVRAGPRTLRYQPELILARQLRTVCGGSVCGVDWSFAGHLLDELLGFRSIIPCTLDPLHFVVKQWAMAVLHPLWTASATLASNTVTS